MTAITEKLVAITGMRNYRQMLPIPFVQLLKIAELALSRL